MKNDSALSEVGTIQKESSFRKIPLILFNYFLPYLFILPLGKPVTVVSFMTLLSDHGVSIDMNNENISSTCLIHRSFC